jgi:hypothetical protein
MQPSTTWDCLRSRCFARNVGHLVYSPCILGKEELESMCVPALHVRRVKRGDAKYDCDSCLLQVNYQRARHKKWDLNLAPLAHKSSDSPDSAISEGSPRDLLSREFDHGLKNSHHHQPETRRAEDLYTLKSDIVSATCFFLPRTANSLSARSFLSVPDGMCFGPLVRFLIHLHPENSSRRAYPGQKKNCGDGHRHENVQKVAHVKLSRPEANVCQQGT